MFKAMTTISVLMLYFALTFFLENKLYLLIQSLTIIAVFFDVSWFFMGIEDFKKLVFLIY